MENAQLIVSKSEGSASSVARCSLCDEVFSLSGSSSTDPITGQRQLNDVFDRHVREKHSWRADANRTAALRLRKMMEEFES